MLMLLSPFIIIGVVSKLRNIQLSSIIERYEEQLFVDYTFASIVNNLDLDEKTESE